MKSKAPSKFSISSTATDDEIWVKVLDLLPSEDREQADKCSSVIQEPYLGGKEIIIRRSNQTNIAYASISEINKDENEWAVYREA